MDLEPDLPPGVVSVVGRLMTWNPAQRFQSAADAADALRKLAAQLADQPAAAGSPAADDADEDDPPDPPADPAQPLPTLLCVERRPARKGILAEYFGARGFDVSLCDDADAALARVGLDPPDAVLLMGEALGDDLFGLFGTLKAQGAGGEPIAVVALVTAAQAEKRNALDPTGTARVLAQPVSLRDVRTELFRALKEVLSRSRLIRLRDHKKLAARGDA